VWEGRGMAEAVIAHTVLEPMAVLRPFIKRFEVTRYLTERTHTLLPDTSLVAFKEKHGAVRMEELARGAGLSLSALEKRFRKMVGASVCFERASKTRPPASEWGRQAK
jgi:AraC-like DNA-binding protein